MCATRSGLRRGRHPLRIDSILPATVDPAEVLIDSILELNADPDAMHGILVQLPLPPHFPLAAAAERDLSADKDVDGFHLYNVGGLVVGNTVFPPCTPYGVVKLLEHEGIELEGKNVVVVGASNIVGKPMALDADAARCDGVHLPRQDPRSRAVHHPRRHPGGRGRQAESDPAADGEDRRVVIDVGINRLPNGSWSATWISKACARRRRTSRRCPAASAR